MKFSTTSALLALSAIASAAPAEHEAIEKRAVCTYFGFTYSCAGSGTTPATSTRAATTAATVPATTTATTASATSTGGSSTGGASKYTSGSSATDITSNTGCTELTVIFARGTSEGGNIGSVAGPPMYKQLLSDLGASKLTLQGVDYPADAAGNSNCGAAGGGDMADKVQTILSRCPNTKIALSGYSQGACVVHNAVQSQGVDASKIGAVVLFGTYTILLVTTLEVIADIKQATHSMANPLAAFHLARCLRSVLAATVSAVAVAAARVTLRMVVMPRRPRRSLRTLREPTKICSDSSILACRNDSWLG